tara:strand:+ start:1464 stop:1808 length:345 start_codon:yes stop_codon:yes gene_type:complete
LQSQLNKRLYEIVNAGILPLPSARATAVKSESRGAGFATACGMSIPRVVASPSTKDCSSLNIDQKFTSLMPSMNFHHGLLLNYYFINLSGHTAKLVQSPALRSENLAASWGAAP